MHARYVAATMLLAVPIALTADQGPLRPMSAVQIEGAGRQAQAPAAQDPVQPAPVPPLAPRPVTGLDQVLEHPELEKRLSVDLGDTTPIRELLGIIIDEETQLTLVVDPTITGDFSGNLRNVTVRQALDLIAEQAGLDYTIRGNVLRVFPRALEERIYEIDYVITQRSGNRALSASTQTTAGAAGGGTGGAGGATGGAGGQGGGGGGGSAQVGGTDAPNLFDDLEEAISGMLSPDGRVTINRTAGLMQVTDRTSRLDAIDAYFERMMARVTRQVRIEARVIEVTLRESTQAGINWDAVLNIAGSSITLGQSLPSAGSFTLGGRFGDNFNVLFNAFKTQGDANVLSSPAVTAMNNQPAIINAGDIEGFFTTTTQRDAQGNLVQTSENLQTVTVGVVLSVTPQISADGIIMLSMNPSITDRAGTVTSVSGQTAPIINQRATDTVVRVRDGETIVIAGLMQDKTTYEQSKVPFLGDLPLIRNFFRKTDKRKTKTDLVIMLTPRIMGPTDVAETTSGEIRRLDTARRSAAEKAK